MRNDLIIAAKFQKSCDYYYQSGDKITGVKQIDVDGSGPLNASYVLCNMTGSHAASVIDNSFGDSIQVRAPNMKHMTYKIEYR